MPNLIRHPASLPRIPAVAAILARYDRRKVETFIEVAISLLDTLDGDADREDDDADSENENRFPGTGWAEWHTFASLSLCVWWMKWRSMAS